MKDNFRPSAAQPNPPSVKQVEDRGELDLTLLIEQHQKEIWEWKQKESQWIKDKNQLDGNKKIIEELSVKLVEMAKANIAFKKRAQEAEELQDRVKQLDSSLVSALEINENHQRYNAQLQIRLTEVEEDNKKLSKQIQDLTTSRKFGDGTH